MEMLKQGKEIRYIFQRKLGTYSKRKLKKVCSVISNFSRPVQILKALSGPKVGTVGLA